MAQPAQGGTKSGRAAVPAQPAGRQGGRQVPALSVSRRDAAATLRPDCGRSAPCNASESRIVAKMFDLF
jgi:hypothetical protein